MVGLGGLEPPTSRLSGGRSNRLSYRPVEHALRLMLPRDLLHPTRGEIDGLSLALALVSLARAHWLGSPHSALSLARSSAETFTVLAAETKREGRNERVPVSKN